MAINFPDSPTSGQSFTASGRTWIWDGNTWESAGVQLQVSNISDLTATATEINYTDGVTSAIQGQINGKANASHTHGMADLTAFQITSPATNQTLQYNGTKWVNAAASSGETISSFLLMGA